MSNMFDNYDKLQQNYVPNNLNKAFPVPPTCKKIEETRPNKPYDMYDEMGKFIGYFWNYGDTVSLDFTITGEYTVEGNAIISTVSEQEPNTETVGYIGQYYINVVDNKVWKCTTINGNIYTWTDVTGVENPVGSKSVYIDAEDYLKDKTLYFKLYNFRGEMVYEETQEASTSCIINIGEELSKKLVRGNYTANLTLFDNYTGDYETLFSDSDGIFLVK